MNWSISYPTARKTHICAMCSRIINPGERYLRGSGFGDGTVWSWSECVHCEAVRRLYDITDGDEYDADLFDCWADEARDVTELRHAAGFRMKWRTKLGNLLLVPNREPSA